ncbi:MAG: starch-binding protein [Erysipelotrichales bacterium]|nr:starch-binding protein [Erysipelotrichales bacterium]
MKKSVLSMALVMLLGLVSCGVADSSNSSNGSISLDDSISNSVGPSSNVDNPNGNSTSSNNNPNSSSSNNNSNSTSTPSGEVLPVISNIKVLVKAASSYTHIYAWNTTNGSTTEYCGGWPGTTLKKYDDTWLCYDFAEGMTAVNVIFNIGSNQNQTGDLSVSGVGYHWYDQGKWSHSDYYGGDFSSSNPGGGGGGSQLPMDPVEAKTYKDFSIWNDLGDDYFKVLHPYKGSRTDFRDETIYFAITTRFYDGDPSNNVDCWDSKNPASDPAWRGDFKGLIEKLDYIKALGFTAVWITPVVENASGYDYHGYHALDFTKIDSRYESDDVSFETLLDEVHSRDMKLVLDVVFNHTSNFGERNLFPMFEKNGSDLSSINCLSILENSGLPENYFSLNGDQQYNARIANMKNTKNDGSDPNDIYHHYGNFSWESFGEQVAQIAGDCVDLNTENPIVAEYLVKCYGDFIRLGVDYFRIDTMKHISRLTFNNYLLPGLYEFARRCGNNNFYMFGEVCARVREVWNHGIPALSAPFYTWKESKEYPWGDKVTNLASIEKAYNDNSTVKNQPTSTNAKLNGVTYHKPDHSKASGAGVIDFPMHWNFRYASDAFRVAKENDQYFEDSTYNVVYVDSHDYGPDGQDRLRFAGGTDAWAENMSLMFTFRGVPCIYYGSEIEFQKGKVIDDGPNTALANTGRAYFGDHLVGNVNATGFAKYTASGKVNETLNSTLSKHLQKLNQIRMAVPALRRGQYTTSNTSGNMAFIRRYTEGNIDSLACVTISGSATFSGLPNGTYVDLVSGQRITVTNGSLSTGSVSKGNARIFVLENSSTGTLSQIGGSLTYLK